MIEFECLADPRRAIDDFMQRSQHVAVIVFKRSPICPTSFAAEDEFNAWRCDRPPDNAIAVTVIDVIEARSLARGITAELGVEHESPQLLWFESNALRWYGSHRAITKEKLDELCRTRPTGPTHGA